MKVGGSKTTGRVEQEQCRGTGRAARGRAERLPQQHGGGPHAVAAQQLPPARCAHSYRMGPSRLPLANCRTIGSSAAGEATRQVGGVCRARQATRTAKDSAECWLGSSASPDQVCAVAGSGTSKSGSRAPTHGNKLHHGALPPTTACPTHPYSTHPQAAELQQQALTRGARRLRRAPQATFPGPNMRFSRSTQAQILSRCAHPWCQTPPRCPATPPGPRAGR